MGAQGAARGREGTLGSKVVALGQLRIKVSMKECQALF
jgi:hypothetical protein